MKRIQEFNRQFESGFRAKVISKLEFKQNFFGLIVDFGSSDEQDKPGSAHYLEHLLFNKKDGDLSLAFENLGANVNAFTSFNETMFYCTGVDHLSKLIELLFQLVGQPYFTNAMVKKEEPIILQELMMYQDQPNWEINSHLMTEMFANSNLGVDVAGTSSSIKSINSQDLKEVYARNYVSSKICFVACGDFSEYQAKKLFRLADRLQKQYFKPEKSIIEDQAAKLGEMRNLTIQAKSDSQLFGLGIYLPKFKKVLASIDLAQIILEIMLESRLSVSSPFFERMNRNNLLDSSLQISVNYTRQGDYVTIFGVSNQAQKVIEAIKSELAKKISAEDNDYFANFFKVKKREWLAQVIRTENDIPNLAIQMAEEMLNQEDLYQNIDLLEKMNVQRFLQLSQEMLADCQFCSVVSKKEDD